MYKAILGALLLLFRDFCVRFTERGLTANEKQEIEDCLVQEILQKNKAIRENISIDDLEDLKDESSLNRNRDHYIIRYSMLGNDPIARSALHIVMEYEHRLLREFA